MRGVQHGQHRAVLPCRRAAHCTGCSAVVPCRAPHLVHGRQVAGSLWVLLDDQRLAEADVGPEVHQVVAQRGAALLPVVARACSGGSGRGARGASEAGPQLPTGAAPLLPLPPPCRGPLLPRRTRHRLTSRLAAAARVCALQRLLHLLITDAQRARGVEVGVGGGVLQPGGAGQGGGRCECAVGKGCQLPAAPPAAGATLGPCPPSRPALTAMTSRRLPPALTRPLQEEERCTLAAALYRRWSKRRSALRPVRSAFSSSRTSEVP